MAHPIEHSAAFNLIKSTMHVNKSCNAAHPLCVPLRLNDSPKSMAQQPNRARPGPHGFMPHPLLFVRGNHAQREGGRNVSHTEK
jgi:hypothetical protein